MPERGQRRKGGIPEWMGRDGVPGKRKALYVPRRHGSAHPPVDGFAARFAATGCLFYDSRWAQQKAEEQHQVERLRPAKLTPRTTGDADRRTGRGRAYATPAYVAETLDWKTRFEALLAEASLILEPTAGITLKSTGAAVWRPSADESDLDAVLAELKNGWAS